MKYAIIIPDGCADEPQEALQGKTPLQAASTPAMDSIAFQCLYRTAPVYHILIVGYSYATINVSRYGV